jgi:hypothetical protein
MINIDAKLILSDLKDEGWLIDVYSIRLNQKDYTRVSIRRGNAIMDSDKFGYHGDLKFKISQIEDRVDRLLGLIKSNGDVNIKICNIKSAPDKDYMYKNIGWDVIRNVDELFSKWDKYIFGILFDFDDKCI